ncbi:hypothetical protein DSM112329_01711 [Paraconexibacter sp. AEG42_29]|uniref:Uncharacterized protein n=1 Tax=Paraconexibacter sp. AEG42_29 TaxID=2997339 RepID=A0AAU7AT79_9ACTN
MSTGVRNTGIILLLALGVYALPGGGDTAAFLGALFSTLILASFVFAAWRMYREHRVSLYGLGDRDRGMLYGSVAAIVLAAAGSNKLLNGTGPEIVLWLGLVGGAIYGFYTVYTNFRAYNF